MSRRTRKRRAAGGGNPLGRAALVSLVAAVVAAAAGYGILRGYLHSEGFRKLLSEETGRAAGVAGEFAPFRWDGLAVRTEGFRAEGSGTVARLHAEGLVTEVSLAGVTRGVWELHGTDVGRLDVELDVTRDDAAPPAGGEAAEKQTESKRSRWLPRKVEIHGLDIRNASLAARTGKGTATARGMSAKVEREGPREAYRATIRGGSIHLPQEWMPEIRLGEARLRYQDGSVFLTSADASAWGGGRLELAGEWDGASRAYSLEGSAKGIQCGELLNETWSRRLTGEISSTFVVNGGTAGTTATGTLRLDQGVLTALPVLDALAAYADTRRFRVLTLNEARADWHWRNGELKLSNLRMAAEGLMRLEGDLTIRGKELDGLFMLGLAPGILSRIPGAETEVFIAGERGLHWSPVRITGTIDDPREDITERLITAAGMRMFEKLPETGERVLKFTRSVLGESPPEMIERGVKVLEEGTGIIREVEGVLDGILDKRRRIFGEPKPGRD